MKSLDFSVQTDSSVPIGDQIVSHFQDLILSGKLPHNHRLPSGMQLAEEWGCGYVTVQNALRRLADKGLARRKPQKGTYVNASNILHTVGVLVGPALKDPMHAYHRALALGVENKIINQKQWPPGVKEQNPKAFGQWAVRIYDDLRAADDPDYRSVGLHNLLSDLERNAFAGFVVIGIDTSRLKSLEILDGKPMVLASMAEESCVRWDNTDFILSTVRVLAEQGCREMVYFQTDARTDTPDCIKFFETCAGLGLPRPHLRSIPAKYLNAAQERLLQEVAHDEVIKYFREPPPAHRKGPVGVISSDDIVAQGAAVALLRMGLDHPKKALLATTVNEGLAVYYPIPVIKYEHSITRAVDHVAESLWRCLCGEPVTQVTLKGRLVLPSSA
jgi:DNA-binding LacI/PurR family transcriptional regulator